MNKLNSAIVSILLENYQRVIPRDLFNESMLLKSLGRLSLLIHDNQLPSRLSIDTDGGPFKIVQDESGQLTVENITLMYGNEMLDFHTPLNSRVNYPLYVEYEYEEVEVFDDKGGITKEFLEFLEELDNQ